MPLRPPPGPAFFILGGIELRGVPADDADRLLSQSKVVGLLVYLALAPQGRLQRRDRLVGLLWPELDQAHARAALRKAVHLVRSCLGADTLTTRGDEEVALAEGALWCDAVDLHVSAESGKLARAVELYRGELLPGFHLPDCGDFEFWLEEQRSGALARAVSAAGDLAKELEATSQPTKAAQMARHTARLAWSDERVLRRCLVQLDRLGDRAGALQLFELFARRLRAELDAEPSPETMALVATMRAAPAR